MADGARGGQPTSAATSPNRRLKLQTSFGRAVMWSKGYGSAEAKQAFTRDDNCLTIDNPEERFGIYYGQCGVNILRGELAPARDVAEGFLRDAQREGWKPAITVAHRLVGLVFLTQGHFREARDHFEEAVKI